MSNVPQKVEYIQRITPRIRAIARLLVYGLLTEKEIQETLQISGSYLRHLKADPMFKEELQRQTSIKEEIAADTMLEIARKNTRCLEIVDEELGSTPEQGDSFARNRRWEVAKWVMGTQGITPIKQVRTDNRNVNFTAAMDRLVERHKKSRGDTGDGSSA